MRHYHFPHHHGPPSSYPGGRFPWKWRLVAFFVMLPILGCVFCLIILPRLNESGRPTPNRQQPPGPVDGLKRGANAGKDGLPPGVKPGPVFGVGLLDAARAAEHPIAGKFDEARGKAVVVTGLLGAGAPGAIGYAPFAGDTANLLRRGIRPLQPVGVK